MSSKNKELKMFTLDQIKDEFIGEIGTEKRTQYEQELQLEVLGEIIRKVRLERNLKTTRQLQFLQPDFKQKK